MAKRMGGDEALLFYFCKYLFVDAIAFFEKQMKRGDGDGLEIFWYGRFFGGTPRPRIFSKQWVDQLAGFGVRRYGGSGQKPFLIFFNRRGW